MCEPKFWFCSILTVKNKPTLLRPYVKMNKLTFSLSKSHFCDINQNGFGYQKGKACFTVLDIISGYSRQSEMLVHFNGLIVKEVS